MPYRRRNFGRRRRTYRKRPITYGQIGKKIWRDVRWLKSVINVEKKYLDLITAGALPSTGGTLALLNGCTLGDTATNRDGQSVKFVSLNFKGSLAMNNSAETTFVRIAFVIDRQPNAGTTTVSNIWSSATPTALRGIGTGYRYHVLKDMQFALSNGGRESVYFEKTLKLRFHTRYNTSNNGDVTDIVTNALYMVYLSDQATNTPTLNINTRLRFIDN